MSRLSVIALTVLGVVTTTLGADFIDPLGSTAIQFTVLATAESCKPLKVTWTLTGESPTAVSQAMSLLYSNVNIDQLGGPIPQPETVVFTTSSVRAGDLEYTWQHATIPQSGRYVINGTYNGKEGASISASLPFTYTLDDTSCMGIQPPESSTTVAPVVKPVPSSEESSSGDIGSKTGAIAGAVIGVIVVGVVVTILFCHRRRRIAQSKVSHARSKASRYTHNWSIGDKRPLPSGMNTPSSPAASPFGATTFAQSRSNSAANRLEEDAEKSYTYHGEDPDKYDTLPTLRKNSNRYSNGALHAAMSKQNSGLAAFNNERIQSGSTGIIPPSLTYEDPFLDPVNRPKRVSNLSVPSTARTDHRGSDVPSPIPSSAGNASPIVPPRTLSNTVTKPTRKPVPQYKDNSIELKDTSTQGHSNRSPVDISGSSTSHALSSSVESSGAWGHERASIIGNRDIGLAAQGDGPVHYLMPDRPSME